MVTLTTERSGNSEEEWLLEVVGKVDTQHNNGEAGQLNWLRGIARSTGS